MFVRSLFALSLMCLSGLAHGQATEEPKWLKDARAREGKLGRTAMIKSADETFVTKLPAKLVGKIDQQDGGYTLTLDIGSEAPMTCEVVIDGFDLGAILRTVALNTFAELEQVQGKIDAKAVEGQDAGVIGRSPFMTVDWLYRVNDGKAAKLGAIKQIAATKNGHGLYCAHIDLGYTKTFRSVATAFVDSIEFSNAAAQPQYLEISTAALGDRRVGVAVISVEKDADGDLRLVNSSSLLVPLSADTLRSQDAFHLQWARPDATMINATHVVTSNGEVETNVSLKRSEENEWTVQGVFNQKKVEATIKAESDPVTWFGQALERRALFEQKVVVGAPKTEPVWTVASPEAFVASKFTVLSLVDEQRLAAREEAAGMVAEAIIDRATGLPTSVTVQLGPQTMKLERIYVEGSF